MLEERFIRTANKYHWAVKGHLIPEGTSDEEIIKIHDSYLKRLWGNHEALLCRDEFEKLWEQRLMEK